MIFYLVYYSWEIAGSHEGHATCIWFRKVSTAIAVESGRNRGNAEAAGTTTTTDGSQSWWQRTGHAGHTGTVSVCYRWRIQPTDFGRDCYPPGLHLYRSYLVLHVGGMGLLRKFLFRLHLHEHYRVRRLRATGDYFPNVKTKHFPWHQYLSL